jgi:glycosyltransferase involved in cell wall biosynthesis
MRVLSAILFSPRGGSSHAALALARGLGENGWSVTLLAGSRPDLGAIGDAREFYGDVRPVDFDPALASEDPMGYEGPPGTAPLHPSYEDRPGAPDRVFASLDDLDYERQVRAWSTELVRAGAAEADVLHLHHLTPLNEAAARVAPHVPVVGQLHGTELLMLERIAAGAPESWRYAERWAMRLRTWAQGCARIVVVPAGLERAADLLDVDRERLVPLPNGVDTHLFYPRSLDRQEFWRTVLAEHPQGCLPGEAAGSARYSIEQVAHLTAGTVLLYVGRFTAVKRLDRLISAYARARELARGPAGLVLVGGHPGEWEGEHPAALAERLHVPDVFLAGWRAQAALPEFFSAADAVVLSSEREQFGQVLVEGMACELPAIAPRMLGPASIIDDGVTGWLVPPADAAAMAATLAEVIDDPGERERRGRLAREAAVERFSWSGIATALASVLEQAATGPLAAAPNAP